MLGTKATLHLVVEECTHPYRLCLSPAALLPVDKSGLPVETVLTVLTGVISTSSLSRQFVLVQVSTRLRQVGPES